MTQSENDRKVDFFQKNNKYNKKITTKQFSKKMITFGMLRSGSCYG